MVESGAKSKNEQSVIDTPLSGSPPLRLLDASHQDAAGAQHGLHQPQVIACQLAAVHVHRHPSLVVHADQHLPLQHH